MVEVAHNNGETLVLWAEQVVDGDLDVVELDKSGRGGGGVGSLDLLRLDSLASLDQDHGESLVGLAANDKVVAEHTVGDPLLRSVDNII